MDVGFSYPGEGSVWVAILDVWEEQMGAEPLQSCIPKDMKVILGKNHCTVEEKIGSLGLNHLLQEEQESNKGILYILKKIFP
jgi:hypothetical protein